jgi:hypothetical protein
MHLLARSQLIVSSKHRFLPTRLGSESPYIMVSCEFHKSGFYSHNKIFGIKPLEEYLEKSIQLLAPWNIEQMMVIHPHLRHSFHNFYQLCTTVSEELPSMNFCV